MKKKILLLACILTLLLLNISCSNQEKILDNNADYVAACAELYTVFWDESFPAAQTARDDFRFVFELNQDETDIISEKTATLFFTVSDINSSNDYEDSKQNEKDIAYLHSVLASELSVYFPDKALLIRWVQDYLTTRENYEATLDAAESINTNSNFEMEFLSLSELTEEEAADYGPDHPETILNSDGKVTGYYFNYPYESKDWRLAQINIESEPYHFYEIKPGDDISIVRAKMAELEYEESERFDIYSGTNTESYSKYQIYVTFGTEKDSTVISFIIISAYDPNALNVIY